MFLSSTLSCTYNDESCIVTPHVLLSAQVVRFLLGNLTHGHHEMECPKCACDTSMDSSTVEERKPESLK